MHEVLRAVIAQLNAMLTDEAGHHVAVLCGHLCTLARVVGRYEVPFGAHLCDEQNARATRLLRGQTEGFENGGPRDALHCHQVRPVAVPEKLAFELMRHYLPDICELPSHTRNECKQFRII